MLIYGEKFRLRKSETLFAKTLDKNQLQKSQTSSSAQKLLELDMQICCPEYMKAYLLPTEILIRRYKLLPTLFMQEIPVIPNQFTDNLTYGVTSFSDFILPKSVVAAKLVFKLSPDAPLIYKIKWFLSKRITYIYDK